MTHDEAEPGMREHLDRLRSALAPLTFATVGELAVFMEIGSKESATYMREMLADEVTLEVILTACGIAPGMLGAYEAVVLDRPMWEMTHRLARLGVHRPCVSMVDGARWAVAAAVHDPHAEVHDFMRPWDDAGPGGWVYAAAGFAREEMASASPDQARLVAAMLGIPVGEAL